MRDIVILSSADWDNPFWTNKQHMAVLFANHGWRVLYVDSLGLRQPTMKGRDLTRIGKRLLKAWPWPVRVRERIWRNSPLVLPFHRYDWARKINRVILALTLRWHLYLLGMKEPLLWTYNPLLSELCMALPHKGIVYHCVDDLGASPHINETTIRDGEKELSKQADICFTTSPELQERMSVLFSNCIYESNVCDYELFHSAVTETYPEPEALKAIPHPRLVFVGALSEYKVNFKLIDTVSQRLPNIHWVLIGSHGEGQPDTQALPNRPNLHVLGPKAYADLPSYMSHCDVAALPAPHNSYTKNMFPMKFFEYLAAGLPVIATRLSSLNQFEELYFQADTADEFCAVLKTVLSGARRNTEAIEQACRFHSWTARFERMEKALDTVFKK